MNWNSHTNKMNWRKSKIHFSKSIGQKSAIEFGQWTKWSSQKKTFELLMAGTWLRTACLKGKLEFMFFFKPWSPFDIVFQDYSSGTELAKKFCAKFCFMAVTALNSFVWKGSINLLKSVRFSGNLFDLIWWDMPGPGGGLPYETDGDARRKFWI